MPTRVLLIVAIVAVSFSPALAQITVDFGDKDAIDVFLQNVSRMVRDPIFLAVSILIIVVSRKFVYWGMMVVGGLAGPLGYFASLQTQFGYEYYKEGIMPWLTAIVFGLGLGFIAVFAFRFIGARE